MVLTTLKLYFISKKNTALSGFSIKLDDIEDEKENNVTGYTTFSGNIR